MDMQKDYDVAILGGGLAGLTLAMQLKQSEPSLKVAVIEKRKDEAPDAAHKVGESTVELGTFYLRETLNLKEYLESTHLFKHGLRFFFSPQVREVLEKRVEHGAKNELHVPSHQIDRGVFENDICQMVKKLGVDVFMGAIVKNLELDDEQGHSTTFIQGVTETTITSNWAVDATGRSNLIKRKLGLSKECEHNINSVWFRVKGDIDVQDWSQDDNWKKTINPGLRRLGTVHFMGKGYWVWFIPLSSGNTSVGIVADPRFHDFSSFNKLDKAYEWLESNEPLCFKHLVDKKEDVLDFKVLKKYSYETKQFYSADKWGLVGEAGAFLDPFYSPGTDFISMSNSWVNDLIVRDFRGEDIYTRSIIYDKVHTKLFENWIPIYLEKYELFDNAQVMCVKITWDFAVYWGIPTLMFSNNALTNIEVLRKLFTVENSFGERFGKLNKQVQDFYLQWGRMENPELSGVYVDPVSLPFNKALQTGIETIHESNEALIAKLEENLSILERFAAEIFRVVSQKLKGTPEDMAVDPYKMSLDLTKEELLDIAASETAIQRDEEMAQSTAVLWLEEKVMF